MRQIIVISSYVARGTVGLQATLAALTRPDYEVMALPTVVLSNHLGHKLSAGMVVAPENLSAMTAALDGNGWLAGVDAVLTGYLPSADHVEWAAATVERIKTLNPVAIFVADPVLGDDPGGLYINRDAAEAVRKRLLPIADMATPNRFELAWLTSADVSDRETAIVASRALPVAIVAATSIPDGPALLANILVEAGQSLAVTVPRRRHAPHGTGDYFAGLLLAAKLDSLGSEDALRGATTAVTRAIDASIDGTQLRFGV